MLIDVWSKIKLLWCLPSQPILFHLIYTLHTCVLYQSVGNTNRFGCVFFFCFLFFSSSSYFYISELQMCWNAYGHCVQILNSDWIGCNFSVFLIVYLSFILLHWNNENIDLSCLQYWICLGKAKERANEHSRQMCKSTRTSDNCENITTKKTKKLKHTRNIYTQLAWICFWFKLFFLCAIFNSVQFYFSLSFIHSSVIFPLFCLDWNCKWHLVCSYVDCWHIFFLYAENDKVCSRN